MLSLSIEAHAVRGISLRFLAAQLRFIGTGTWFAHLLIVLLTAVLLHQFRTFSTLQPLQVLTLLTVSAPLIALAGALVLVRSFRHGMLELELSTKHSADKLVIARVGILGITDALCLSVLLLILNLGIELKGYLIVISLLVPFVIGTAGCLWIMNRFRSKDQGCLMFTAFLVMIQFFISFWHEALYAQSGTWIWVVILLLASIISVAELRKLPAAYRNSDVLVQA